VRQLQWTPSHIQTRLTHRLRSSLCGRGNATSFLRSNLAHAATFNMCRYPQAFLDQRGEEYDDWFDKDALIVRAQECEVNTGRAADPPRLQPDDKTQVTHCKRLFRGPIGCCVMTVHRLVSIPSAGCAS